MIYNIGIAIFLLIASIIDIKTREVPNLLSYGLMTFVIINIYSKLYFGFNYQLLYSIIISFVISGFIVLLSKVNKGILKGINKNKLLSFLVLAITVTPLIAYFFDLANPFQYYIGFIIATIVGTLLYTTGQWGGGDVKLLMALGMFYGITFNKIPEFLILFILMFLVGGLIGIYYSIYNAVKNFKEFKKRAKKILISRNVKILRYVIIIIAAAFIITGLIQKSNLSYLYFGIGFVIWIGFYVWILVKSVEDITLIREKKVTELVEGDWLVKPIKTGNKIVKPNKIGLTLDQLKILKNSKIKTVTIKEGLPFVPSFFISFILVEFINLGLPF